MYDQRPSTFAQTSKCWCRLEKVKKCVKYFNVAYNINNIFKSEQLWLIFGVSVFALSIPLNPMLYIVYCILYIVYSYVPVVCLGRNIVKFYIHNIWITKQHRHLKNEQSFKKVCYKKTTYKNNIGIDNINPLVLGFQNARLYCSISASSRGQNI
jgi:hypothetical protein